MGMGGVCGVRPLCSPGSVRTCKRFTFSGGRSEPLTIGSAAVRCSRQAEGAAIRVWFACLLGGGEPSAAGIGMTSENRLCALVCWKQMGASVSGCQYQDEPRCPNPHLCSGRPGGMPSRLGKGFCNSLMRTPHICVSRSLMIEDSENGLRLV